MIAEDQNVPSASSEDSSSAPADPIKARNLRDRLRANGILSTFVVFGSARAMDRQTWEERMAAAKAAAQSAESEAAAKAAVASIEKLRRLEWCCEWYEKTRQLARRLMEWVQTQEARKAIANVMREIPLVIAGDDPLHFRSQLDGLESGALCAAALGTGGGPGLMEAANKGARDVPGARSVGFGMTLPFESCLNRYIDSELAFKFHYFFTRKFWMTYAALAVIAAPGGVGTLDELMEVLTLKQCRKLKRDIPIILFGKSYWKKVVNFDYLVECGLVDFDEVQQIFFTDEVDEAFSFLTNIFLGGKLLSGNSVKHKSMAAMHALIKQEDANAKCCKAAVRLNPNGVCCIHVREHFLCAPAVKQALSWAPPSANGEYATNMFGALEETLSVPSETQRQDGTYREGNGT
ncbi:lysine decarboxylase family protein [Cyclospora cayetanensis]|uniref:Lysine decarboxylase family protein n=1 Tax=Cyclospora cayetanensis TaxID=88456 RepID=A0A1D3DAL8_9EIME|nr:lysine decarboxylase family protein [Cyclospora cayetanensis]